MQSSKQTPKILGAVFALAVGGGAFWGLTSGLEAAQTSANACRDARLSLPDQTRCDTDLKAASSDTAKKQVIAQYQAKADMPARPMTAPSVAPTTDTAPQATPPIAPQ
jgi:hypothetical protein